MRVPGGMKDMAGLALEAVALPVVAVSVLDEPAGLAAWRADRLDRSDGVVGAEALVLVADTRLSATVALGLAADEDGGPGEPDHGVAQVAQVRKMRSNR
jgi:hypothetical protein